jgi:hypothetical protein
MPPGVSWQASQGHPTALTFVPYIIHHSSSSSSGLFKIFRQWVRPGEFGHGALVRSPSDTFNCSYWGVDGKFGYGADWNDASGEIVSYHVSKVLRMWIVPPGKIVSFGSSGFPEWFSEHFCTTREAMRAYFHRDDKMKHARAYGWLQVRARARARRNRHARTCSRFTHGMLHLLIASTALTGVSCYMSASASHVHCAFAFVVPAAGMVAQRWRHAVRHSPGAALPRGLRERHPARDCCAAANWPAGLLSGRAADRPALPLHGNAPVKGTQYTGVRRRERRQNMLTSGRSSDGARLGGASRDGAFRWR